MTRTNRVDLVTPSVVFEVASTWAGQMPGFPTDELWRVVVDGAAYPARGLLRECLRVVTGQELEPGSVPVGNQYHDANQVLARLGFEVVTRDLLTGLRFTPGSLYTREDVQRAVGMKPSKGGNWATGHHRYGLDTFVFATLDDAGSTGHDYDNRLNGNRFRWQTKNTVSDQSPSFLLMVGGDGDTHIFTREHVRESFTYRGIGIAESWHGSNPVTVEWSLEPIETIQLLYGSAAAGALEGERRTVLTQHRKREGKLRRAKIATSLEGFGSIVCEVCEMNLTGRYGELAKHIVEVHHLIAIAAGERVSTLAELALICPTCHRLIHARQPMLTLDEARAI